MKFNKVISYIFHPVLAPVIGTILYFILFPKHISKTLELTIITAVFIGTYLFPLLFLVILKKTKNIANYQLENIEERKFPLLFFILTSYILATLIKMNGITIDLSLFFYGTTVALLMAYLLLYFKFKVSLHLIGIGGLIGFFTVFSYEYRMNTLLVLSLFFVIAGFVASARISLKAHHVKEVFFGFLIGLASQTAVYLL